MLLKGTSIRSASTFRLPTSAPSTKKRSIPEKALPVDDHVSTPALPAKKQQPPEEQVVRNRGDVSAMRSRHNARMRIPSSGRPLAQSVHFRRRKSPRWFLRTPDSAARDRRQQVFVRHAPVALWATRRRSGRPPDLPPPSARGDVVDS